MSTIQQHGSPFKFVNKDSKSESLSHSDSSGLSSTEIKSHAQRFSRQQQRLKVQVIPNKAIALVGWHKGVIGKGRETHQKSQSNQKGSGQFSKAGAIHHHQQMKHEMRGMGPWAMVRKGNSDPFNVFAIPIDSKANRMMTFFKTVILPTVESGADWADSASFSYDWNNAVGFLCDEMTTLAHLTRVAIAMSVGETPKGMQQVLLHKSRSMILLRDRIADHRITESSTYQTIYLLLLSEAYARDLPAALVHANLLSELLQSGQIQENFQFVFRTFYYDYQRAAMSQSRLCFDIEHWVPTFFKPFWCSVTERLPPCASAEAILRDLDPSIDDEAMRSIFSDIRQAHIVLNSPVAETKYTSDEKSRYLRSFSPWVMARLHHLYLDTAEVLENSPLPGGDLWSTHLRVQVFFSLAAHCYIRKLVNVDATSFGQAEIFSANAGILSKLQEVLCEYESNTASTELIKYERIQLWALYVGAYTEQADALKEGPPAEDRWFNVRFARHARSMKLAFWQDVSAILKNIHYFDGLRPHGSQWFSKTMNAKRLSLK